MAFIASEYGSVVLVRSLRNVVRRLSVKRAAVLGECGNVCLGLLGGLSRRFSLGSFLFSVEG